MDARADGDKRDVRRPMNAFLIFCKRHRSIVREKNPDLDNRSVTRILGDLWANLKEDEKVVYTDLAKQYKDAFMKANPDYKWHNPEKTLNCQKSLLALAKPTNAKVLKNETNILPEGSIIPGKLADPSNMGGLSLLLMAGEQTGPVSLASKSMLYTGTSVVKILEPPTLHMNSRTEEACSRVTVESLGQLAPSIENKSIVPASRGVEIDMKPRGVKPSIQVKNLAPERKMWADLTQAKLGNGEILVKMSKIDARPVKSLESKSLLYQAVAAPKVPQRSLLAEALEYKFDDEGYSETFRDKLEKEGFSEILREKSGPFKNNFEKSGTVKNSFEKSGTFKNNFDKKDYSDILRENCESFKDKNSDIIRDNSEIITDKSENGSSPDCLKDNSEIVMDKSDKGNNPDIITDNSEAFNKVAKGSYSDILRDNSAKTKIANFQNLGKSFEDQIHSSKLEQKLVNKTDEKENLTDPLSKESISSDDVKYEQRDSDEQDDESAIVTCGKLVVNHIIDKLFSSELTTAARKMNNNNVDEVDSGKKEKSEAEIKNDVKMESCDNENGNIRCKVEEDSKEIPVETNESVLDTDSEVCKCVPTEDAKLMETDSNDSKAEENENSKPQITRSRKHATSTCTDSNECESEDLDELHPVRKSRRRNRGQRYQELINEGIIQRSKERTAALQQASPKGESINEDLQPLEQFNSYILPETAIRRIRKRTTSESAKDKILHMDDVKRYKTGDFDLEAQIATLPACSVENMGRKRGFARQRHSSECIHTQRKMLDCDSSAITLPTFNVEKAVSLPPHMKHPSPDSIAEPVIGSRKRKARRHSITHMLPAPSTLVKNGKVKADGNSLGPCLIIPPVQTLCEKTDFGESGSNLIIAPVKNGSTTSSNTSEMCSKWSKFDKMNDKFSGSDNKPSLPEYEVGDQTNTSVNVPKTESGHSVGSDKIETESQTGSIRFVANNTSLLSEPVTQSSDILRDQSFSAVSDSRVQKTVAQEKLEYLEINKVTDTDQNRETHPGEDSSDLENMDLKGLEHSSCVGDPGKFEYASLSREKGLADLVREKGIEDFVREKGLAELVKDDKDVNSNTSNPPWNTVQSRTEI